MGAGSSGRARTELRRHRSRACGGGGTTRPVDREITQTPHQMSPSTTGRATTAGGDDPNGTVHADRLWAALTNARTGAQPKTRVHTEDAVFRFYLPTAHTLGQVFGPVPARPRGCRTGCGTRARPSRAGLATPDRPRNRPGRPRRDPPPAPARPHPHRPASPPPGRPPCPAVHRRPPPHRRMTGPVGRPAVPIRRTVARAKGARVVRPNCAQPLACSTSTDRRGH
jgi:hypothetical protein